jgi:hypothetical protein
MKLKYRIDPEEKVCPFHRQLTILNIDWAIIDNRAYIHCVIEFGNYNESNEFTPLNLRLYSNYKIMLKIENTTLVNPITGGQEIDGELAENCTMGEYDFFIDMMNSNVHLSTILENGINRIILRGRHNI